jgi:hypothetical protein
VPEPSGAVPIKTGGIERLVISPPQILPDLSARSSPARKSSATRLTVEKPDDGEDELLEILSQPRDRKQRNEVIQ